MPRLVCPINIAMIILSAKIFKKYNINRIIQLRVTDRHIAQAFFILKIVFIAKSKKNKIVIPINTIVINSILNYFPP